MSAKTLNVQAANGTITLSGAVDNAMQRDAAARQAAAVPGVKEVINNLQVVAPTPAPVAETHQRHRSRKSLHRRRHPRRGRPSAADVQRRSQSRQVKSRNAAPAAPGAPRAPPPVEPPKPQKVTIPSGTNLAVRLVDAIDSETAQAGQSFRATLDSPLSIDGDVVIPSGYDVTGHVVDVKSAGKFAGKSELILQLDRIAVGNKSYNIQTNQYSAREVQGAKTRQQRLAQARLLEPSSVELPAVVRARRSARPPAVESAEAYRRPRRDSRSSCLRRRC